MKRWLLFVLIFLAIPACFAQKKSSASKKTFSNYLPNVIDGGKLYVNNCSGCHGTRGFSDTSVASALPKKPTVIGDPEVLKTLSPQFVFEFITRGSMEKGMPSFRQMDEKDRWNIAAYIFTLNSNFQKPPDNARATVSWEDSRDQTDGEILDTLKKRGVPENYHQRELSAIRSLLQ